MRGLLESGIAIVVVEGGMLELEDEEEELDWPLGLRRGRKGTKEVDQVE